MYNGVSRPSQRQTLLGELPRGARYRALNLME
jgi:hypothetical protein